MNPIKKKLSIPKANPVRSRNAVPVEAKNGMFGHLGLGFRGLGV